MASALTPTTNDIPGFAGYPPAQPAASGQQVNVAEAIWRYRWAVMIPVIVGAVCGLLIYLQLPETYRSTTRLMIESDNAAVLDQLTGEVMGGVPSIDIVKSQLFSDRVMAMAFAAPRMQPFREDFTNDLGVFASDVLDNMELEPEVEDLKTAQSLVMLLHFDNENEAMVKEAVTSFSESLQRYYNDNYKSGRNDLRKLVRQASEELYPQLLEQERRYGDFRRSAPLVWDSEGRAINPHRERMMALLESRSELSERVASKKIELAQLEQIAEQMKEDPENALGVVGELLEKKFTLPSTENRLNELQQGDFVLAETLLKEDLLPLSIERAKLAEQFNENHPSVKALDVQIEGMREEMAKLLADRTDRVKELIGETMADPRQRATEAMKAIILAASSEVKMLEAQSELLREQWVEEQRSAVKLAQFEMDDEQQRRSIERTRELLDEMENKLAAFNMDDEDRGTRVVELKSPTQAYQVGPSILKTVGVGGVLGILLGCGLAMLLEKNANTFRDSDEIADTLGTPVLTHVPFYKGRVKKGSKSEPNPYEELDPSLAVIHMPAAVASEAIRSCRTNLFFELSGKRSNGSIIQVTSPLPGDGKSTIAGNLACSIAQAGKRTLLIDCDLRRPQMTDNFGLEGENGLTNALNGECEPLDCCHVTPLQNLSVMPSGPIPGNPAEALTLPEMSSLLALLREKYDYIIIDTPPLLVVTDPSIIASEVDGVVMTLRIRRKSRHNSRESINILRSVGANIIGLVINNSDEAGTSDGYRGHGYYRYGRQTSRYYRAASKNSSGARKAPLVVMSRGLATNVEAKPSVLNAQKVAEHSQGAFGAEDMPSHPNNGSGNGV